MKQRLLPLPALLPITLAACSDLVPPEEVTEEIPEERTALKGTVYILSREMANQQEMFRSTNTRTGEKIEYNLEALNPDTGDSFLEHINAEEGSTISRTTVSSHSPRSSFFNFDYLSTDFIMVSHPHEVLYLNSETAELKETFTINNDVLPFMIWRVQ